MDVAQEGNTHSSLICASTPKNVVQEPRLRAASGGLEHTGGEERGTLGWEGEEMKWTAAAGSSVPDM